MYISISYSKEWTEEDTQLIPIPMCMWWRSAAGLGRSILSGEICNLTYTRMHIEMQVFIPILVAGWPRNGHDGKLMAKILLTIQVNCMPILSEPGTKDEHIHTFLLHPRCFCVDHFHTLSAVSSNVVS